MQNMKSQGPDMYQDGCDFIIYSVVFGYIRKKKHLPLARPGSIPCEHKRPYFIFLSSGTDTKVALNKKGERH